MSEKLTPNQRRVLRVMREGGTLEGFALKRDGVKIGQTTERVIRQLQTMKLITPVRFLASTYILTEKGEAVSLEGPTYIGFY